MDKDDFFCRTDVETRISMLEWYTCGGTRGSPSPGLDVGDSMASKKGRRGRHPGWILLPNGSRTPLGELLILQYPGSILSTELEQEGARAWGGNGGRRLSPLQPAIARPLGRDASPGGPGCERNHSWIRPMEDACDGHPGQPHPRHH